MVMHQTDFFLLMSPCTSPGLQGVCKVPIVWLGDEGQPRDVPQNEMQLARCDDNGLSLFFTTDMTL